MRKPRNDRFPRQTAPLSCAPPLAILLPFGNNASALGDDDIDGLLELSLQELINVPIVTASRRQETRSATPAHVVVVTRQQIRERRYKNLADLLEDLPGIDLQRGTKSSQYNQFAVQGYVGPNRLLVMLDGVRIDHPAGGNFPLAENLALYAARQVEILYGPAAALYGADAVAGVVNIISEAGNAGDGSWFSAGSGNFGSREYSFMTGTKTPQGLAISAGGHWQKSARADLANHYPGKFASVPAVVNGVTVIPAAAREGYVGDIASHSFFARLDLDKRFTIGFFRHRFNSLTSTGDPPAMAYYTRDANWQTTHNTVYAQYRFQLAPDVEGELTANHARMEVDPDAFYNNTFNAYQNGYSYVFGERSAIEQNLSWRINEAQQLSAGIGYQKYKAIEAASLPEPYHTSQSASRQGMFYPNTTLPFTVNDASFNNASAYLQLQSQWSSSFSSTAGVRFDHHSAYKSSVNPRLGVVWKPLQKHVFKALYGESFRAPAPEEILSSYGTFDGSRDAAGRYVGTDFRVPNFSLDPEKIRSYSLVWDWQPSDSLNLVSNLYHSRANRLILTQESQDVFAIPGAILIRPETKGNAGEQRQFGLDLSAQWRFRINSVWSGDLWGSVSFIRGRIDEGDGSDWEIPYVASRKLKLGATFRYADQFTITPRLRLTDATTNGRKKAPADPLLPAAHCKRSMSPSSRCTTPGYAVVDLHLGWHRLLNRQASLWLDIYNLFDRRYYAAGGAGSRTFWDMPQQPRSWMLAFEYRF